jgi:nucleoid-associated protein YgaU
MKKGIIRAIPVVTMFALVLGGCTRGRNAGAEDASDAPKELFQPEVIATSAVEANSERPLAGPPLGAHYRVGKIDSAKSIAVRFYGDDRYAEDILELNKEAIRKARGLKPGMVIALPPVRERDTTARP